MSNYQAFETLREHKARLHGSVLLGTGVELAAWSNCNDRVTQESADHHTLSLYVADGYECYQQVPGGWRNGGGPDRFCIMPRQYASTWDVRSDLSFVHLYCTDGHLRQLAEQTWDRSPAAINVEPRSFGEDPQITLLYRQFLLNCDWRDSANLLALSSASNLLMSHLIQRYSQLQWKLPQAQRPGACGGQAGAGIYRKPPRSAFAVGGSGGAGRVERIPFRPHVQARHRAGAAPVCDARPAAAGGTAAAAQPTADHRDRAGVRLQLRQPLQQPLQGGLWICSAAGAAGALTERECSMDQPFAGLGVLFVAGFGPITRESDESKAFYVEALGLPLKPMPGNETYLLSEQGALDGVKHFALWPLAQAAQSCFGDDRWPADLALPQAWIEFDVADMAAATQGLVDRGYRLLVVNREEPWGQSVTRLLSPEGLLVGVTYTPWLR